MGGGKTCIVLWQNEKENLRLWSKTALVYWAFYCRSANGHPVDAKAMLGQIVDDVCRGDPARFVLGHGCRADAEPLGKLDLRFAERFPDGSEPPASLKIFGFHAENICPFHAQTQWHFSM